MTIEVAMLISIVSVSFGIYAGYCTIKRNQCNDVKSNAAQLTTVIVKLENIGTGITRIESEISNVKKESAESKERLIKVEESAKQAHHRLDTYDKRFKLVNMDE